MKKKLLITFFVIIILILGNQLKIPGIIETQASNNQSWMLGFGSGFTWFTLGISPYIFANIATAILTSGISPFFSNLKKKHGDDHLFLFLFRTVIALVFAFILGNEFKNLALESRTYTITSTETKVIGCLVLGTFISILLSRLIDKKGIGRGTSLILLFTITNSTIKNFISYLIDAGLNVSSLINFSVCLIILIVFIILMLLYCHLSKEIAIDDENADIKEDKSVITIPYNSAGLTPIFVTTTILTFVAKVVEFNTTVYTILFYILFTVLMFIISLKSISPNKRAKSMMVKGLMIKGIVPGKDTEKFLRKQVVYTAFKSIIFLICFEGVLSFVKNYFTPLSNISMPTLLLLGMCLYQIIVSIKTLMLENKEIELLY